MDITIANKQLSATISPHGAELNSLKSVNGREYIWEGNPEFWGKHSPVLFPVVGTLKNNEYAYNGTTYSLPRHGFARDNIFTVTNRQETSAIFTLTANEDSLAAYPFNFELQLKYTLAGNRLLIDYTIFNQGDRVMPFSLGAHPAFALGNDFETYSLLFDADDLLICHQLQNDLVSGMVTTLPLNEKSLRLSYRLFEKDALILKTLKSKTVSIAESGRPFLKVNTGNFPSLGIWTKPGAPFICIEPWQGYSDGTENNGNISLKEGIVLLPAHHEKRYNLSIEILG